MERLSLTPHSSRQHQASTGLIRVLSSVYEELIQLDPFQYLQSGSGTGAAADPAAAQAWAAYYAQQQQQQQQPPPSSGYPQYSDSGGSQKLESRQYDKKLDESEIKKKVSIFT